MGPALDLITNMQRSNSFKGLSGSEQQAGSVGTVPGGGVTGLSSSGGGGIMMPPPFLPHNQHHQQQQQQSNQGLQQLFQHQHQQQQQQHPQLQQLQRQLLMRQMSAPVGSTANAPDDASSSSTATPAGSIGGSGNVSSSVLSRASSVPPIGTGGGATADAPNGAPLQPPPQGLSFHDGGGNVDGGDKTQQRVSFHESANNGSVAADGGGGGSGGGGGQSSSKRRSSSGSSKLATKWQDDDKDLPYRRQIIRLIAQLLSERKANPTQKWLASLPYKARKLEEQLYKTAPSFDVYYDRSTLKHRLKKVANAITFQFREAKRRSSTRSSISSVSSATSMTSTADLLDKSQISSSWAESGATAAPLAGGLAVGDGATGGGSGANAPLPAQAQVASLPAAVHPPQKPPDIHEHQARTQSLQEMIMANIEAQKKLILDLQSSSGMGNPDGGTGGGGPLQMLNGVGTTVGNNGVTAALASGIGIQQQSQQGSSVPSVGGGPMGNQQIPGGVSGTFSTNSHVGIAAMTAAAPGGGGMPGQMMQPPQQQQGSSNASSVGGGNNFPNNMMGGNNSLQLNQANLALIQHQQQSQQSLQQQQQQQQAGVSVGLDRSLQGQQFSNHNSLLEGSSDHLQANPSQDSGGEPFSLEPDSFEW